MTTRKSARLFLAATLFVAASASPAAAQTFHNLDFEDVVLNEPIDPLHPFGAVAAVPFWTFSHNNPPQLAPHLGGYAQQFLANDILAPGNQMGPFSPVQGHYSLYMEEATFNDGLPLASVSQTGFIPVGTQSIRLWGIDSSPYVVGYPWTLTLDGTVIPLNFVGVATLAGDATAFAGGVHTLKIELNPTAYDRHGIQTSGRLDLIRFSPLPASEAPEPISSVLAAAALVAFHHACRIAYSQRDSR